MKKIILKRIQEGYPDYISGEELSHEFEITRAAVWKHIKSLRGMGYVIDSSPKKGYRMKMGQKPYCKSEIECRLKTNLIGNKIYFLEEVDSTNIYAKLISDDYTGSGAVVLSKKQTKGRGRLGRSWDVSDYKGISMSILLRPDLLPQEANFLTITVAVAVYEALRKYLPDSAGIKWPNDILCNGKKICGILTEMSSEMEMIKYVIIGIGINVNHDSIDFGEDIKGKATSLKQCMKISEDIALIDVVIDVLESIDAQYKVLIDEGKEKILSEWRKYSITLGKEVTAISRKREIKGIAVDISDTGSLIIEREGDHKKEELISGEISLTKTYN